MPTPQTNGRVSRRVAAIGQSATLAMDAKAKALRARGEEVISFGAGEPDFPTPAHIVAAAVEACRDPANHRYSPAAGLPELREAVAAKTARDSGLQVEPSEVLITNGAKHAVYNAFAALLDSGDEVLLPAPYWTTFPEPIALCGGVPIVVRAGAAQGFRVGVDQLEAAVTARTKALVFVSPSNPTGAVYPRDEVEAIGHWAADRGVWVLTDEIYEHFTYGEHRFSSVPALVPAARERCVVINGASKTYAMTGWRVGWMIAPPDVVAGAANLQSHATSNVANVSQRAALAALAGDLAAVAEMRAAFERRGRRMYELLGGIGGLELLAPQGAFYAFPDLSAFLGRAIRGRTPRSTAELSELLLEEARVAVVPGEAFGAPGHVRLSFALGDDELEEGCGRIAGLLAEAAETAGAT